MMSLQVSDSASNRNEQIDNAAKAIGRSGQKRLVFEAIHHGKRSEKTLAEIASATGLTAKQVLDAAKPLANKNVIDQRRSDGQTVYRKNSFLQAHKREVLALAGNPAKLAKYPTKRNHPSYAPKFVRVPVSTASVKRITIDEIATFRKVRRIDTTEFLPRDISEAAFKRGVQRVLGEPGRFTDWGGERNDLLSTRLRVNGKRRAVAFAFKGPGTKGPLTPGKMGKNGDQLQRLFRSTAEVFLVQYWQVITETVIDQMNSLAMAKSVMDGREIMFGVIDGVDSNRIYLGYIDRFN